jgi:hypothetical protein
VYSRKRKLVGELDTVTQHLGREPAMAGNYGVDKGLAARQETADRVKHHRLRRSRRHILIR